MRAGKLLIGVFALSVSTLHAEPIGLVLSGGGAKGAYEVGVWKAMAEAGWTKDVRVISGTSIGAINGAMFASVNDPAKINRLWVERISELMALFANDVRTTLQGGLDEASEVIKLRQKFIEEGKRKFAAKRGIPVDDLLPHEIKQVEKDADVMASSKLAQVGKNTVDKFPDHRREYTDSIRKLLDEQLPANWRKDAPLVYVTALSKRDHQAKRFPLNEESAERRREIVTASAAIPNVLAPVKIDGVDYQDGGYGEGGDNTPIAPIVENHPEIRTIVIVYLNNENRLGNGRIRRLHYLKHRLIEIIPTQDTQGLLGCADPTVETTKKLIELGYRDALQVIAQAKDQRP